GRTGTRMTVRGYYTICNEPFAVQTAAGKRPAAADLEATIDNLRLAARSKRSGAKEIGAIRVQLIEPMTREQGQQHHTLSPDHHGPGRGPIGSRKCLKDFEPRRQVGLQSAVALGNKHPKASRGYEVAKEIIRQFAGGFNFSGARSD